MSPLRVDDVPGSSELGEYERSEVERSPQGGVGEMGPLMGPPEVLGLLCFWRICFRWTPAGLEDVEIIDYH
jgi:hypothetical protein